MRQTLKLLTFFFVLGLFFSLGSQLTGAQERTAPSLMPLDGGSLLSPPGGGMGFGQGRLGTPKPEGITVDLSRIHFTAKLLTPQVKPGGVAKFELLFQPDTGNYIYLWSEQVKENAQLTLVGIAEPTAWRVLQVTTDAKTVEVEDAPQFNHYVPGNIKLHLEVRIPQDTKPGKVNFRGVTGAAACDSQGCAMGIFGGEFAAELEVLSEEKKLPSEQTSVTAKLTPLSYYEKVVPIVEKTKYGEAPAGGSDKPASDTKGTALDKSAGTLSMTLWQAILYGIIGGLLLNLMPCVLPVISLKIMAFINAAGESRRKIFLLNLSYTLGLMTMFLVFAAAVVLFQHHYGEKLLWGEQLGYTWFRTALIALVFLMGLSFLGIWEIPVPSFLGRGKFAKMQRKEGYLGAFGKGLLSTLLGVSCTAPFLGTAMGFALGQSSLIIFLMFIAIGLGMSLPYILIGIFPSWLSKLPKPGEWMETLKEFMGFLLLGTVVFLVGSVAPEELTPTLALLVALWFGVWAIGKLDYSSSPERKTLVWAVALAVPALVVLLGFLGETAEPWQPYDKEKILAEQKAGKVVVVDFTATWCANCLTNKKFVLDQKPFRNWVKENKAAMFRADFTNRSPEIGKAIASHKAGGIPLLVVYPAGDGEPAILDSLYTWNGLKEVLEKAAK